MTITLYNTKSRRREPFVPLDEKHVRLYVCGPTVYDRAHLGNARAVVVFDMLNRLLRHDYGLKAVTYVRNFTDIDDKINARAQQSGQPIEGITAKTMRWYLEDMAALGTLEPDKMPRATEYVPEMISMINTLIKQGNAYVAEGHVLFRVRSYTGYGELSGRSIDDMIAGSRVEIAPYKDDPMDFVLWKPSDENLPGWNSPWGRGRPGWHIECSAMAYDLLGDSFDIHGGGNDLTFPHHENEIAQSRCAHPKGEFARFWMHNEMLQVDGKKMSKSAGNFFTVHDLLEQGISGDVIRLVMLGTHYRKPMDWTDRKRSDAEATLMKWWGLAENASSGLKLSSNFINAIRDDLNVPLAISELHGMFARSDSSGLRAALDFLGFLPMDNRPQHILSSDQTAKINHLTAKWRAARDEKRWAEADMLRDQLSALGIRADADDSSWSLTETFNPTTLDSLS